MKNADDRTEHIIWSDQADVNRSLDNRCLIVMLRHFYLTWVDLDKVRLQFVILAKIL
jgi:hypothetical protein